MLVLLLVLDVWMLLQQQLAVLPTAQVQLLLHLPGLGTSE
jgi:hypothetical protein